MKATKNVTTGKPMYWKEGKTKEEKGVTPQGIRKSVCQWAARCGGSSMEMMNNGRWKTVMDMLTYYNSGGQQSDELTEAGGVDTIWAIWPWKRVTVAGFDGTSQM